MASIDGLDHRKDTILSLFRNTVIELGNSPALRHEVEGEWRTLSWNDYALRALSFAAGLRARGVRKGDHVVMLTRNSPEFHVVDVAILLLGAIPVSVYNSPSVEGLTHIVRDSAATACFVNDPVFAVRMREAVQASGLDPVLIEHSATADLPEGTMTYDEVLTTDPLNLEDCIAEASSSDVAVMLYTSGTSGPPKGVPLTHSNLVYATRTFTARSGVPLRGKRQLSYLPMAHIGERFATHYAHIGAGSEVTTCPDISRLHPTLAATHPHMLFGAPRMWEVLHDRMMVELGKRPDELRAFQSALDHVEGGLEQAADRAVINRVLQEFGVDSVEIAIVGSAPLPPHVHQFWRTCGLPLADYYGQTETTGMGSWDPHDITLGTVGRPLDGTQMRISDDGEIQVHGPGVFSGYYNDPEKTSRSFTEDGWFRTGDLGRFDDRGNLVYAGRRNDMIVPTSGHNVSPASIESVLSKHPLIAYSCIVGTGRPHVGAVIVLDVEATADWLANRQDGTEVADDVVSSPAAVEEIDAFLETVNANLSGAERVRSRVIVPDDWDLDSATLTATGKLKRSGVLSRYADLIDAMYAPVVHRV